MDISAARLRLGQIGWLAGKPAGFSQTLLSQASLRKLQKGEFAHHVADPPGSFYGVAEGALLVLIPLASGGLEYGHLYRPGHWFGVTAAAAPVDRQVALEAATDTTLLMVPPGAIVDLLSKSGDSAKYILSLVLIGQLLAIRSGADLLIQDRRKRLAARLLTLSGLSLNQMATAQPCELPITQEQLAAMSGLSRNTVSRVLADLEVAGLCRRGYGTIQVPDLQALEAVLAQDRAL